MIMKNEIIKRNKLYIVMYHYVRNLKYSRYSRIRGMDLSLFREQLQYFNEKFCIVTMEEVLNAIKDEFTLPENAMLLTFDDGYIDNFTYVMPILEELKVQGSFFIPGKTFTEHKVLDVNKIHYVLATAKIEDLLKDMYTKMNYYRGVEFDFPSNEELFEEYVEKGNRYDSKEIVFVKYMLQTVLPEEVRKHIISELFEKYVGVDEEKLAYELYMTKEQIRMMKRHGMFIGIHGYDHYWLANLSDLQMKSDINKALKVMEEFIDRKEWVMNYPYGSYDDRVIKYISELGCCLGLTTEVQRADIRMDDRYKLPRFDCNDFPHKSNKYINF